MVGVFRRSFSFPNKSPAKPALSLHVRSISLPCRSHPLIFQLNDQISDLKSWTTSLPSDNSRSASEICDGLNRLTAVHNLLDDVLNLPQTQESLRHQPLRINNLLDHFLRFVDAYGTFQTLILSLKEEHSAAQIAIRRKDEEKIAIYVRSRKRLARNIAKLASTVKIKKAEAGAAAAADLSAVIEEVVGATAAVSVALFDEIAESLWTRKPWTWRGLDRISKKAGIRELREIGSENLRELKKKGKEETKMAMKKMRELEDWISDIEARSQMVFRSLISARVSLLNALSQQQIL